MGLFEKIRDIIKPSKQKKSNSEWVIDVNDMEPQNMVLPRQRPKLKPLYTFFRLGPMYLTAEYPVDIEPLKEIIEPDGVIDSTIYRQNPDFFHNIEDYNNDVLAKGPTELLERLKSDLLLLAEKHNYPGAYTLYGSLDNQNDMYFKKAALLGNKEGMVTHGINLYTRGELEKGREFVERGAELGDNVGMLIMAISYEHGTITSIDYNKAAYFYKRLIKENNNYYAMNNLGVMYIAANYFHTAYKLFEQAHLLYEQDDELRKHVQFHGQTEMLQNLESCSILLSLPPEERIIRSVIQYHSPHIDPIFCYFRQVQPYVPEQKSKPELWQPNGLAEIEPSDIQEHHNSKGSLVPLRHEVKYPFDDFVFPIIPIKIDNPLIHGLQQKIIFLEKQVHVELNQYIQSNLGKIKETFRKYNYIFVYLPAHSQSAIDDFNIIHYEVDQAIGYKKEKGELLGNILSDIRTTQFESIYLSEIINNQFLPDNCAGFLHYTPNPNDPTITENYEFILFPYQAGTDWDKAFAVLMDTIAALPVVNFGKKKQLPNDTMLLIDNEFKLYLVDSSLNHLTEEIKMPGLSKALYFTLLRHTDGCTLKTLVDYSADILTFYQALGSRKNAFQSIQDLTDPTKNSANEKISRIRKAFETALAQYDAQIDFFVPVGKKGEKYSVNLDRNRIIWQPEEINLF